MLVTLLRRRIAHQGHAACWSMGGRSRLLRPNVALQGLARDLEPQLLGDRDAQDDLAAYLLFRSCEHDIAQLQERLARVDAMSRGVRAGITFTL